MDMFDRARDALDNAAAEDPRNSGIQIALGTVAIATGLLAVAEEIRGLRDDLANRAS